MKTINGTLQWNPDATVFVAGASTLILEAYPDLKPKPDSTTACIELVKQALADSMNSNLQHDTIQGMGN